MVLVAILIMLYALVREHLKEESATEHPEEIRPIEISFKTSLKRAGVAAVLLLAATGLIAVILPPKSPDVAGPSPAHENIPPAATTQQEAPKPREVTKKQVEDAVREANRLQAKYRSEYPDDVAAKGETTREVAWINEQLRQENAGFVVSPPKDKVASRGEPCAHPRVEFDNSTFNDTKTAVTLNGNVPCTKFNGTTVNGGNKGVEENEKQQPTPQQGPGSDNTTYGNVAPPASGSRNTYVGPTDSHGNTIIPAGTAVGAGAKADPTSVAIGSGAGTGSAPITNNCPNGICISGGLVENPTVNNFTTSTPAPPSHFIQKPFPAVVPDPVPSPSADPMVISTWKQRTISGMGLGSNPGVNVTITTDGPFIDDPTFVVQCNIPCTGSASTNYSASFKGFTVDSDPRIVGVEFDSPKRMSTGTEVNFRIFSNDSRAVSVIAAGAFRIPKPQ